MKTGFLAGAALSLALVGCSAERIPLSPTGPDHPPLVIAFMSERPPSPPFSADIYFDDLRNSAGPYRPPNVDTSDLEGPCALSGDGRTMAFFTLRFPVGSTALMLLYDVAQAKTTIPSKINDLTYPQNPALSYDGRFLAVQYQIGGPFDLYVGVQDLVADSLLAVPNLNEPNSANFDPSLSGDGSLIAFASNRGTSLGSYDIYLYSVPGDSFIALPGLNSAASELSPSLSRDGRYLAFQSGRPQSGSPVDSLIDVYVYDRQTSSLLSLPGANTPMGEIQPAISPDGRYLAYATESVGGRDVRLYDIREKRLLRIDSLNDPYFFDYFPSLASP